MRIKKLTILTLSATFALCANGSLANTNSHIDNYIERIKLHGSKNVNQLIYNDAKKNDDYEYQIGVPEDVKISNPGDQYESLDVYKSPSALYKTMDENGNYYETTNKYALETMPMDVDPNEDNDSFEKASTVYFVGQDEGHYSNWVQWGATINQKTSGWWLWEKKYVDKDFYSFDVTVSGTLNVKLLNIPSGCDYDMRLYKHANSKDNTLSTLNFDNYLSISQKAGNANEEINYSVTPGTYYIAVYSYQDKTWSDESYLIQFQQTETNTSSTTKNYYIPTGRSNGDLGAIWRSGYNPVGIEPTSLSVDNAKYRFDCYKNYPYITHLYDKYNGQDKDIEYARIYIWDVNTRATIYAVAQELLNQIDEKLNNKLDETNKVNMSINGASIVVSFGSIALSIANLANIAVAITGPLGLAVSVTSTVIAVVGQFFSAYFNSSYNAKLRDFRDFLINLKAAMEVSRYSTNKEVVMMRFRYRFGSEFDWGTKYYIDFHPVYRISDTNLYNSNYIGYISDESPINGTVHGFKNASQISSYLR